MKKITSKALAIILAVIMLAAMVPMQVFAANQQFVVDLSVSNGAITYGAMGALYGLGNEGIPSENMLAPLKMQVMCQKPEDGLQHPNGDVTEVSEYYFSNNGDEIEIYMQDAYKDWPYVRTSVAEFHNIIRDIVAETKVSPYYGKLTYVPYNEPDWIWFYPIGANTQAFCEEWKSTYQLIRSLDPYTKIAGPNLSYYDDTFYYNFLAYCVENNCVPDVMTWHELNGTFQTEWDLHYAQYRAHEVSLGVSPREICINEYLETDDDLGVPGSIIRYLAKFERDDVYGCSAYWTSAGSLNDCVTQNNKATGGWWLYKWYSDLTGTEVKVTPPNWNAKGLQGVAALDTSKRQARVIFGGSAASTDIVVQGIDSVSAFGNKVHVTVWGVDDSGRSSAGDMNPSSGPYFKQEGDYTVSGGKITVPVSGMNARSAYLMIITPAKATSTANTTTRYEAEYANISGTAAITYGSNTGYSGTYFVEGYGGTSNAATTFSINADGDGYYDITLRYSAGPFTGAPTSRNLKLVVNNSLDTLVPLTQTSDWMTWNAVTTRVYLQDGINTLSYQAYSNDEIDCANIDCIDIVKTSANGTVYEAELSSNTRGGTAIVESNSGASGGSYVGWIGAGAANTLTFNVNAPSAGYYRMVINYANAEIGDGAANYNTNVVDRYANITVNGSSTQKLYFRNTYSWNTFRSTMTEVYLNAGNNTIKFANSEGYVPNIDKIIIAAPFAGSNASSSGQGDAPTQGDTSTSVSTLDGIYYIQNVNSGLYMDVYNASSADGANICQWAYNGGDNQKFQLVSTGEQDVYYMLTGASNYASSVDVYDISSADGANICQWSFWGGNGQKFKFVKQSDGSYAILTGTTNYTSGLDMYNWSTSNGGNVNQWNYWGGACQRWYLIKA